jgi:multiple sugar transport system substrate-binding protein
MSDRTLKMVMKHHRVDVVGTQSSSLVISSGNAIDLMEKALRWWQRNIRRICVSALVVLTYGFVGCHSQQDSTVTITFWAMGNEGENVQKLLPEFEAEHPQIRVKVQQIPWTAAHEKLLTAFAGNALPDILQLGNTWIPEFSSLGALEPLNRYLQQSQTILPSDYFRGVWETNIIDSILYGIPWYVDTRLLFYRKDILAEAGYPNGPPTWEAWKEASRRIVRTGAAKRYAIFLPTNEWQPAVVLGLEAGSNLLQENNSLGDFSSGKFALAFRFLRSFYQEGLSPTSWLEIQNVYQGFAEGYIAMYISGPWQIGEFRRRLPDSLQDKWLTAPLPARESGRPGISVAGGSSLVLSRTAKHKSEAWKFLEYLSRPETQIRFFALTGNLPARRQVWADPLLKNDRYSQAFFQQLEYVTATPKIPEWEQIAAKLMEYIEKAASLSTSDEEILRALDRDVNAILEKRRWILQRIQAQRPMP